MPYGKVVHVEPPPAGGAHALFDAAVAAGVNCFDTARNYQRAESLIGSWMGGTACSDSRPSVVSKIHPFPMMAEDEISAFLDESLATTRRNLGPAHLAGYLVHNANDFRKPGVAAFLATLQADGRTQATGVSVYDQEQLAAALDHAPDVVDFVQTPVSLFDQRVLQGRAIERCLARNVVLFARSVFLQGVLFMQPAALPAFLAPLADPLRGLGRLATESGRSLTALAIGGVLAETPIASVVIGIADARQLEAAIDAVKRPIPTDLARAARRLCTGIPHELLDPRKWPSPEPAAGPLKTG